ncbi:hypothetical protein RSAG8_03953, partial [Rhizoctonia solani AG-8 WAC10335]
MHALLSLVNRGQRIEVIEISKSGRQGCGTPVHPKRH